MKNKVLGSLGIKIIVWIVLSVSSFSFLIGFYGLALSSSSRQQEHVNQTSYFSTYEANYGIQTEVKAFLSEMEANQFKQSVAEQQFGKKSSNLSMTIKKGQKKLVQNFPYEINAKSITGKLYFEKAKLEQPGDQSSFFQSDEKNADYVVEYTIVQPLTVKDQLFKGYQVYTFLQNHQAEIHYLLYGGFIGVLISSIYLLNAAGHRKNTDEIVLTAWDKIPLEINAFISGGLFIFLMSIVVQNYFSKTLLQQYYKNLFMNVEENLIFALLIELCGIVLGLFFLTIAVRLKAKVFWKNTLLCKIFHVIKKTWVHIQEGTSLTWIAFFLLSIFWFLFLVFRRSLFIFGLVGISFWAVLMFVRQSELLSKVMREYAKGNFNYTVSKEGLTPIFSRQLDDLFKVKDGVQKAIMNQLKSEHLKTELITNVSHDLKTPLTNILNYAQIIKEDKNEDERKEHIDIMIHHADRLKRLTEDVLLASKASTGNMPVHLSNIHCEELLVQIIGEYADRFKDRELEIIKINTNPDLMVQADGELLFRVFENLFSNQLKYALEKTRIYLEVLEKEEHVLFVMKNVSKEPLNINAEELMERFVQGDDSRSHEGSGLGLSIVKSLVQLQNGKFDIEINGDYFQTKIELKKASM